MTNKNQGIILGVVIIVIGCVALLSNIGVLPFFKNLFWTGFFLLLAYAFYYAYKREKKRWWALGISGISLFLAFVFIFEVFPFLPNDLLGVILFWYIAVIFITVYARNQQQWWAIIPAGTFITLGVIVLTDSLRLLDNDLDAFIFFLGIGLTFGFLYGIKDDKNKLQWAKYPAVIITLFSFFLLMTEGSSIFSDILLPIGLVTLGVIMLYNNWRKIKKE